MDWIVAVYSTREQAEEHARLAQEWMQNLRLQVNKARRNGEFSRLADLVKTCPYDATSETYSFADYEVFEVDFCRHVDEYLEFNSEKA